MAKKTKAELIGARLVPGQRYRTQHGAMFECLMVSDKGAAQLRSVMSGATFTADDIRMYEDGSVSWGRIEDLHYTKEASS